VGTFDREHAVEDESIDFFASGHPLVEGLLAHFEEDPKGRVARLEVEIPGGSGRGIVAIYEEGPQIDVVALDTHGRARPDWADAFRRPPLRAVKMKPADAAAHDWAALVTRVATQLGDRLPHAVAVVIVRPT
jgi:ATP-dependent helicase HepA